MPRNPPALSIGFAIANWLVTKIVQTADGRDLFVLKCLGSCGRTFTAADESQIARLTPCALCHADTPVVPEDKLANAVDMSKPGWMPRYPK